jgi:probable rRNA maturation factor
MLVQVVRQGTRSRVVTLSEVRRAAEAMLVALRLRRAELSILLCDDATIQRLNRDYRRKDKPTDVLAFALREGRDGHLAGDLLGDVVISLDTARHQARANHRATREEVRMLLAHGLLHLLGWDHRTAAEDRRMRAEVDRLVAVADVRELRAARAKARRALVGEKKGRSVRRRG